MEKITIPSLCSVDANELRHFIVSLSRVNACYHHLVLSREEHMKLKVAALEATRKFFSKLEYNEQSLYIPQSHRTFDESDLERFYRNMWSHKRKWYHVCLSYLLPHRLYGWFFPYIMD